MAQTSNNLADVLRSTRLAAELSDAQIDTLAGVMLMRDLPRWWPWRPRA